MNKLLWKFAEALATLRLIFIDVFSPVWVRIAVSASGLVIVRTMLKELMKDYTEQQRTEAAVLGVLMLMAFLFANVFLHALIDLLRKGLKR